MARSDRSNGPSSPRVALATRGRSPTRPFESVLFARGGWLFAADDPEEPDFFGDLHLDQVLASMTAGREQYRLEPFFYTPLHEVGAVRYRQEVLRDLEQDATRELIVVFARKMQRMREYLAKVEALHYPLQKQTWSLDAIALYCEAVQSLTAGLAGRELTSRGLLGLRRYLQDYTRSEAFTALEAETGALKDALARIRYLVRIHGGRVTVTRYEGEADYGARVRETFAKFQQGAGKSHLVRLPEYTEMNHVEAQIAERVALLYPDVLSSLAAHYVRRRDFVDGTIARFDREVQLYLAYLELIGPFRAAGLPFCCPHVSTRSKTIAVRDTFDISLASKLVPEGGRVVTNDVHLEGPERVLVVTGPNNGGKTTFARTFGQLHYLASLGLLVPGSRARVFLPDRIYTHFEKQEDIETLRGKLEAELVRVHAILEQATSSSVVVMNESFGSTTLNDALLVGTKVVQQILDLGCLGVYVTFLDEIASLSEATVSMVSQISLQDPAKRTFKVLRKPADGLAYAWAIAEKYGLTYERLMERVGS
jgi:DNA mismatch repair protein MutS